MVIARKFVCTSIFDGEPKPKDFEIQYEELPELGDGGKLQFNLIKFANNKAMNRIVFEFLKMFLKYCSDVLVETIYWSVDPYMRVLMPKLPINSTMIGENIARLTQIFFPLFISNYYLSFKF